MTSEIRIILQPHITWSDGTIYQRGKKYWISIYITRLVNGKKVRKRRRFRGGSTRQQALMVLSQIKEKLFRIQLGIESEESLISPAPIPVAVRTYLETRKPPRLTVRGYVVEGGILSLFRDYLDTARKQTTDHIDRDIIQTYIISLCQTRKPSTAQRHCVAIRLFCDYCVSQKYMATNPCTDIEIPRYTPPPGRVIPRQQLSLFLERLPDPHRLYAETIYYTACRSSEIFNLTLNSLNFEDGTILIYEPKPDKYKIIPMIPYLKERLQYYIAGRNITKGRIFHIKNIGKTLIRISAEVGIAPAVRLKDLRSTAATRIAEVAGLSVAQKALDHASPITTSKYYVTHDIEIMRNALDSLKTDA